MSTRIRTPLVRRALTRPGQSPFDSVAWSRCSVEIKDQDGGVAFGCRDVEAPTTWSDLAVATVARRYLGRGADGQPERSLRALIERVVGAIGAWARDGGQVIDGEQQGALDDEFAALVLTQRATFATPVWLNAGLVERPLTSACFIHRSGGLDPSAARVEHARRADLPAGRRSRDQPLARAVVARGGVAWRRGERAGVVHARLRCVGGHDPGGRTHAAQSEDGRPRRRSSRHPRFHRRQGARGGAWPGAARRRTSAR